jgi:hypothetical protein
MRRRVGAAVVAMLLLSVAGEWLLFTGLPPVPRSVAVVFSGSGVPRTVQYVTATSTPTYAPTPTVYLRPEFQAGVAFPRWGTLAYSSEDPNYETGLNEILAQTGARWVQLAITLEQDGYNSTQVQVGQETPTPASVLAGIEAAHALGLHVFVVPFITLRHVTPFGTQWSGDIRCTTYMTCTAWFTSYWQALKPYLIAAQEAGAEEVAVATELANLEILVPHYWTTLIGEASSVYHGALTYDLNFTTLISHADDLPVWFGDPRLATLGVSAYFSLVDTPVRVAPEAMPGLWQQQVQTPVDALAAVVHKPVLISEIAYRNSADALYKPYLSTTSAPADPAEQAAIYEAAAAAALADPRIQGIYFWAWSLPPFAPNNLPAAQTLRSWYTAPEA